MIEGIYVRKTIFYNFNKAIFRKVLSFTSKKKKQYSEVELNEKYGRMWQGWSVSSKI